MKECCKFWKEQKRIYTEEICINNRMDDGVSPFVRNMRKIIGCPNCLEPFNKPITIDKNAPVLCSQCGSLVMPNWSSCEHCGAVNE